MNTVENTNVELSRYPKDAREKKVAELLVDPFPYQKEGINFLLINHYALLGDEMGLGKTLQALAAAACVKKPTLIVCPAFLKDNWHNEIDKLVSPKWHKLFTVTTYSRLKSSEVLFEGSKIVIADECHYLKNVEAKRTQAFHQYIQTHTPERLMLLSGTPIKNRVPEFFSLLKLLNYNPKTNHNPPELSNYWNFCRAFTHARKVAMGRRTFTKFEGHKNLPRLKELLRGRYLRRKAEEALDLPKINRIDHNIKKCMHEESLAYAWDSYLNGSKKSNSFSQVKAVSALSKAATTATLAKEMVDEGKQVLIFTDHVTSAEFIHEDISESNTARLVTGKISIDRRVDALNEFKAGRAEVLVATIGTLSTGVTLTNCSYIIFNDLSWVPADNWQAEKRIHRIGQEMPCFIYRVTSGQVDQKIVKSLTEKMNTLKEVL